MRRHDDSEAKGAWAMERRADPDWAWLRETYGLEYAECDLLRRAVERGEAVPQERLREPAAAYARRLLQRPWWLRRGSARFHGWGMVGVGLGFCLADAVALMVAGALVTVESAVVHGAFLLVILSFVVNRQWLLARRIQRSARLNSMKE
ncbi:hypothetical protein DZF91_17940 [Actinomadura logoneensis]|uniref:Uncharacterized protein n=1 Tax=Actinomadura logoneensis TaxID=2293572 RepID=A0A372JJW2_9ACTN|nr:hypothetical protein [Actinomadura logoneensis]RFU40301.1 hypothetical protein DZF91_17940 [Actinomadura logoneensis]